MSGLELRLLGTLEVRRDGAPLDLGAPKQRAVLAHLLVNLNQPVSLDRLIEDLWGDQAPPRATASLQAYVSNLRRVLEPDRQPRTPATVLVSRPPGYALVAPEQSVDAWQYEALADEAAATLGAGNAATAIDLAERAEQLWRGEPLADWPYEAFTQPLRTRLEERRARLLEDRAAALLACGREADAATELEAAIASHPLRERLWELRMLALYRSGRQAEALRAYQQARSVLADELGLEPGPALQRLERQILDHDPALAGAGSDATGSAPRLAPLALRPSAQAEVEAAAPGGEPAIVGRDEPFAALAARWASATSGRTEMALVAGEAGVGKTALVEAFAERVVDSGGAVAWGRSQEHAGAAPLWSWIQVVRELTKATDPDDDPSLARLLAHDVTGRAGASDADRIALFDAVAGALRRASTAKPLAVILDDLHWADSDSLTLLEFLVTELRNDPVVIVGTYRPDEALPGSSLATALGAVARRGSVERVELEGLGRDDVERFARDLAGRDLDRETIDLLTARTNGNPFFLSELVRLLASERGLDAGVARDVPAGVRDVVRRRVERLPEDSQSVLTVAAVIGQRFELEVLAAACEIDLDDLLVAVEAPLLTGLLVDVAGDAASLQFSHAMVAETLAGDVPSVRRRRLHARIARAIEDVHAADIDAVVTMLAHHYAEAASIGFASVATTYAVRAAEQAEARAAIDEAPRLWQLAAEAAALDTETDRAARLDIDVRHAAALMRAGRVEGRAAAAAVALASATNEPAELDRRVRAVLTLASHGTTWQWAEFRRVHRDALDAVRSTLDALPGDDSADRARVLAVLAPGLYYVDNAAAKQAGADAIAMARRLGDPRLLAEVIFTVLSLHYEPDDMATMYALATELVQLGEQLDDPVWIATGYAARVGPSMFEGDIADADADYERAAALLAEHPRPPLLAQLERYPVLRRLMEGDIDGAHAAAEHAYDLSRYSLLWTRDETHLAQLAEIAREDGSLGDHEAAIELLATDDRGTTFNTLVLLRILQGRRKEAEQLLRERGGMAQPRRDWLWMAEMVWAAELAALLPDPQAAQQLYAELLPYSGKLASTGSALTCSGPVDLYLGMLARTFGENDAGDRHLAASDDLSRRIGARLWLDKADRARSTGSVVVPLRA